MKKLLSAFLAMMMLLTMLPIGANAAENGDSERDELIALACEVFPEYAGSIRGESTSRTYSLPRSSDNDEVVIYETRRVSDTQTLSYAQYASGRSYIVNMSDDAPLFDPNLTQDQFTNFTGGKYGTVSIAVVPTDSSFSSSFKVTGFQYKIYDNTYDSITSLGTATLPNYNGYTAGGFSISGTPKYAENSSGAANVVYNVTFYYLPGRGGAGQYDSRNEGCQVIMSVHSNSVYIYVN